jgi:chemotaxis protein CheZ
VVQATETAANRIMEAAEAIGDWLRTGARDAESVEAVAERVNTIFEACSFQDITSQRIRRAIEHLQQVETMLTEMAPGTPVEVSASEANPDLAQDDVDRMFG